MTIRTRGTTTSGRAGPGRLVPRRNHWLVPVVLLPALVVAAGCAQAPEAAPPASATASASSTADGPAPSSTAASETPAGPRVEVTVSGRTVTPPPSQVELAVGETLTVVVTADVDTTIHAHGFEVEQPVPAGTPTTIALTGTASGLYEVELHHPDLLLFQVAVR